jgi:hypothetical protein
MLIDPVPDTVPDIEQAVTHTKNPSADYRQSNTEQSFLSLERPYLVQRYCSSFNPPAAIPSNVLENAPFCFSQSSINTDPRDSFAMMRRWCCNGTSKKVDPLLCWRCFNVRNQVLSL